jgi:folate-binding protein YgfZ
MREAGVKVPVPGASGEAYEGYVEARGSAAVRVDGPRGVVSVSGSDTIRFLHGILTNDVASLEPGTSCYAAYLTPQGRMITDMRVLRFADHVLLEVEPGVASALASRLDGSLFTEDVRIEDRSGHVSRLAACGPDAPRVLASAIGGAPASLAEIPLGAHMSVGAGPSAAVVIATDRLGGRTLDLLGAPDWIQSAADRLHRAGAARLGDGATEALRIEAGTPLFAVDMTAETIPLEAGIEGRAISMTKGCYVGQEVIVRILHRGHGRVARRLVGLLVGATGVPAAGTKVSAAGSDAGHVTSAAYSPRAGGPLALAYVQRAHAEPGTAVALGDSGAPAVVVRLPLED